MILPLHRARGGRGGGELLIEHLSNVVRSFCRGGLRSAEAIIARAGLYVDDTRIAEHDAVGVVSDNRAIRAEHASEEKEVRSDGAQRRNVRATERLYSRV